MEANKISILVRRFQIQNEKGLTLIGVMIAAGIMSVVTMGTMTLINEMNKGQTGVAFRAKSDEFAEEVRLLLQSTASCTNTFGGTVLDPTAGSGWEKDVSVIKNQTGGNQYATGYQTNDHYVEFDGAKLNTYQETSATEGSVLVNLKLYTQKSVTGPSAVNRQIKIKTIKDAGTHELTSCEAIGSDTETYWKRSGDDIYYNGGRVGVGTANPTEDLHVYSTNSSRLRLEDSSSYWDVWGGNNLHLQREGSDVMFLSATGNVGIGTTNPGQKLTVAGSGGFTGALSAASTSVTGNASIGGTITSTNATVTGRAVLGAAVADSMYSKSLTVDGNAEIRGKLDIGLKQEVSSCELGKQKGKTCDVQAKCQGGRKVLGGGFFHAGGYSVKIGRSRPSNENEWSCNFLRIEDYTEKTTHECYALCAFIK